MLKELNIEEILFIDIETVPIAPEFGKLAENWRKLWNHKMKFRIDEGEVSEDLYQSAGIMPSLEKLSAFRPDMWFKNTEKLISG